MKSLKALTTFTLVFLISPGAYAGGRSDGGNNRREGGNSGGGGVFVELDVMSVRSYLNDNCERFESFKQQKVDCTVFKSKIEEVGLPGQGLSIENGRLALESGKAVDAINYLPAKIQIGQPGWKNAKGDFALKVGLEAHEFLSLMGIEHTGYYPVSSRLVGELRMSGQLKSVTATAVNGLSWIRAQFPTDKNITITSFKGHDSISGKACNLYLTDTSMEGAREVFYVVSGLVESKNWDDYVGVVTSQSVNSVSENGMNLHSDKSWGNKTKFNNVKIKINLSGKPVSALGQSDLRTINCVMDRSPQD